MRPEDMRTSEAGLEASTFGESIYDEQQLPFEQPWKTWDREADKEGENSTVFWNGGTRYKGEWHRNKKHGRGTQFYKNGDKYEGCWENGMRSGQGTYWKYDAGKYRVQYNGEWVADQRQGFGTFFNAKGEFYQGEWLAGKRNGKGRQTYGGRPPDGFGGDIYEGDWVDNQRHGKGTLSLANGDVFQGEWKRGAKHGPGTFFYEATQKRYDGVWNADIPQCGSYVDIQPLQMPPPNGPALQVLELLESKAVEVQAFFNHMDKL